MSAVGDIFASLSLPVLIDQHADTITHRPRGVEANDTPVSAIVEWDQANRDMQAGDENVRLGTIKVPLSVPATIKSWWVIGDDVCQTTKIVGAEAGYRIIEIQVCDAGIRTKSREKL